LKIMERRTTGTGLKEITKKKRGGEMPSRGILSTKGASERKEAKETKCTHSREKKDLHGGKKKDHNFITGES